MASILPFAALLPNPGIAQRICELPYDVMSSEEARVLAQDNPLSFLRVSKPEIELPPGTDPYSDAVYARGRENLDRLIRDGALVRDSQPCFYLYRQVMGAHAQTGIVAAASCQEYLDGSIKKHEFTRPDKEDDRVRHIETLNAQTGPVFLVHRTDPAIDAFVARAEQQAPYTDFTAPDGVRHTSWRIAGDEDQGFLRDTFARIPALYIADGHHRSAAAARVFQARKGAGGSAGFLAVIFPHHRMRILPYNRVLKDLAGHTPETLLARLAHVLTVRPGGSPTPARKHALALRLGDQWHSLEFLPELTCTDAAPDPTDRLDVSLLQRHVLGPVFGIDNPRTSDRIGFVGGIRGTAELERLVAAGEAACAFSMFPTDIADLMAIADGGGIMPPKSTWFEPKLRDAMFSHVL